MPDGQGFRVAGVSRVVDNDSPGSVRTRIAMPDGAAASQIERR